MWELDHKEGRVLKNWCFWIVVLEKTLESPLDSKDNKPAAKSRQSCLTLCHPVDGSPLGSPIPGILQARTLEWVAISFSNMTNLDSILKSRDITLPTKVHLFNQGYGFSSSHVWMWELDYKESWVLKNWCFWTVVLDKTLDSPLDCKEIQAVHPKGNQPWIFIGRTDAEAEAAIFWPPNVKNWFIGKDPDAGKDWRREEKGMAEDEMVGWHQQLDGHELEQILGDSEGQGGLVYYSSWGHRVWHHWATELNWIVHYMYRPHFVYPFICQWTPHLLPHFSNCE